jgi:ABC-type dipeptide/oligopeptide/nickel transport system ATPase component
MVDVALSIAEKSSDESFLGKYLSANGRRQAAHNRALELLERVGIEDAARRIDSYPHEFSGGMRQRVLIAMALLGQPQLLIADEPTTALDVSVQAQILRLFYRLVKDFHLSVLLITHNLGVVAQLCDQVAVMYAGNIVESGAAQRVFKNQAILIRKDCCARFRPRRPARRACRRAGQYSKSYQPAARLPV